MSDGLSAMVPRQVRVRGTVTLVGQRLSVRSFAILLVAAVVGALALLAGASPLTVVVRVGGLALLAILLGDLPLAGRVGLRWLVYLLVWRARAGRLRLTGVPVVVPADTPGVVATWQGAAAPRWGGRT